MDEKLQNMQNLQHWQTSYLFLQNWYISLSVLVKIEFIEIKMKGVNGRCCWEWLEHDLNWLPTPHNVYKIPHSGLNFTEQKCEGPRSIYSQGAQIS